MMDKTGVLQPWIEKGLRFQQLMITRDNMVTILKDLVSSGDLIIDLSTGIESIEIITWCHDHKVLYLNTSIEVWEDEPDPHSDAYRQTLHFQHTRLQTMTQDWQDAPTCITEHGANPGLISHFVRKGLTDIALRMISDGLTSHPHHLLELISERRFAELSMELGVTVIHCSEIDTQVPSIPKGPGEFVNTWSIVGLHAEAIAPVEIGWGTHEMQVPKSALSPPNGKDNEIFLQSRGLETWMRSWVPHQEITGLAIRHGEIFALSDRLSVVQDERTLYRPTVCYVYRLCDAAIASLKELQRNEYKLPDTLRILEGDDIISGTDTLGALIMGHPYRSWWTGSMLSHHEAEKILPGNNATTIQVAIGCVAAILWMIENPMKGFCLPDDIPHDYILNVAAPYLGTFYSSPSDWTPVCGDEHQTVAGMARDDMSIWQYQNFLSSGIEEERLS